MRKLMAIFAHPDDEGAIGGTLAHYAQQGMEVTLVCATQGEVGEISDPRLATFETLGAVRKKELESACHKLGVQRLEFLEYRDSGMAGTPENEDARALVNADPDKVKEQVVRLIRQLKPDVVITFEPFGWYGHPDHQAVSKWVTAAYSLAGDANAYSNGEAIWQPERFFHAVIPFSKFQAVIQEAAASGYIENNGFDGNLPQEQQLQTEASVTHIIEVHDLFDTKQEAMMAHRTQFGEDNFFRKIPREMMIKSSGTEHFIQVFPSPSTNLSQNRSKDLFANL